MNAQMENGGIERRTFIMHLIFAALNGTLMGITLSLQEVVAKKALNATDLQVTILTIGTPVAWLLASAMTGAMQRSISHRPYLVAAGIVRIVAMAGMFLVSSAWQYIALMFLVILPMGVINPAQNFILARNYPSSRRGARFGIAVSLMNGASLVCSLLVGTLLDINQAWFTWIYLSIGFASGLSAFVLAAIPVPARKEIEPWANPITKMVAMLKKNKGFWIFERNFFIYGCGFLMLTPVIPIYMVDVLQMSYKEISLARGVLGAIGIVIFSPFIGKFHDRHNPFAYASRIFAALALFPLMLLASMFLGKASVYMAYVLYSLAMAGVTITWNIGSIYFAELDREATYQSIHLTLTGVRGILAPILGFVAMHFLGYWAAFLISCGFFITAAFLMRAAAKNLTAESAKTAM